MIRLLDARSGDPTEVRPGSRGLLRLRADLPPGPPPDHDITGLRVRLVADLLTRTAEMRNLQAITVLATDVLATDVLATAGEDGGDADRLAGALGIHPPAGRASGSDVERLLGGPADVRVTSTQPDQAGLAVLVGAARMSQPPAGDPLAIRLALLSAPYHQRADLTEAALAGAGGALTRWRAGVARWAESPSKPVPADLRQRLRAAIEDLDTVSLLAFLDELAASDDVPPGARFESFAYADRVLGLDLVRDIGKA